MKLRDYQRCILNQVINSTDDDLVQLDTGAGKTPIMAAIIDNAPTLCIAHRNHLVTQISQTLTRIGRAHHIIATATIQKACMLGQRHLSSPGLCYVASIQSILSWHKRGKLNIDTSLPFTVLFDEAHHVADCNQWSQLAAIFPNSRRIGFTATPCRLDGKALHKSQGGLFDKMIQAKTLRENGTMKLISMGYLSDYIVYAPPTQLEMQHLKKAANGDYTGASLEYVVNRQRIVADVIKTHRRLASDKKTLVFCVSIANATLTAQAFKDSGVSAAYIASDLSSVEVAKRIEAFKSGAIQVLCNVDMVTEGFDMPQIECVQMLRPTASLGLYRQIVGRVLRPKPDGSPAIIIDHVANTLRHGLPDDNIEWTLTGTPKNRSEPVMACTGCEKMFNIYLKHCPHCGQPSQILARSPILSNLIAAEIIDIDLVRKARAEIAQRELRQAQQEAHDKAAVQFKTELLPHKFNEYKRYGADTVSSMIINIALWFVAQIKDEFQPEQVNAFTQNPVPKDWWLKRFTCKDMQQNNHQKCAKEFKKWLESR